MNNPFKILNVAPETSKEKIIRQVAIAMREKQYDLKLIAEAQKELFDPVRRQAAEFIHVLELDGLIEPQRDNMENKTDSFEGELLRCFDE